MTTAEVPVRVKLRGGNWDAYHSTKPEVLLEGPARTGKTFAWLLRMVKHAQEVPRYNGLIVRKVAATLGNTVLRTLEENVFHEWDSANRRSVLDHVLFFGGSANEPASYEFANGSRIVVGGMDTPSKILGAEYDEIFFNQIEEGTVEDMETLLSRLSHGLIAPCFMADCNPSNNRHWVLQRALSGQMSHLKSRLKDNPAFYDILGNPTDRGAAYIQSLSGMTGTRYQRLVLGEWVGMADAVYQAFDRRIHIVALPAGVRFLKTVIGVDFGDVHDQAAVVLSLDQNNRRWVREVWARQVDDHGAELKRVVGQLKLNYKAIGGRTDPNQSVLAGDLGFNVATQGPGTRQHRIDLVEPLWNLYPGGRVPHDLSLAYATVMHGPYAEPDTPGLMLVEGAPGIEHLAERIEAYHYVQRETETNKDTIVARIDEDPVAALEYANEELAEGGGMMAVAMGWRN